MSHSWAGGMSSVTSNKIQPDVLDDQFLYQSLSGCEDKPFYGAKTVHPKQLFKQDFQLANFMSKNLVDEAE